MYAHLGGVDDADGVDLCLPSGRAAAVRRGWGLESRCWCWVYSRVIAVSTAFAIVDTVARRLEGVMRWGWVEKSGTDMIMVASSDILAGVDSSIGWRGGRNVFRISSES